MSPNITAFQSDKDGKGHIYTCLNNEIHVDVLQETPQDMADYVPTCYETDRPETRGWEFACNRIEIHVRYTYRLTSPSTVRIIAPTRRQQKIRLRQHDEGALYLGTTHITTICQQPLNTSYGL